MQALAPPAMDNDEPLPEGYVLGNQCRKSALCPLACAHDHALPRCVCARARVSHTCVHPPVVTIDPPGPARPPAKTALNLGLWPARARWSKHYSNTWKKHYYHNKKTGKQVPPPRARALSISLCLSRSLPLRCPLLP